MILACVFLLGGAVRTADASSFRCWLKALFPASGGNNPVYEPADFPDHATLLNDVSLLPAVKEMQAYLANRVAAIYRLPTQRAATAYNFGVVEGQRRIALIGGSPAPATGSFLRRVEREWNIPLWYEGWISGLRHPSYALREGVREELEIRLVEARLARAGDAAEAASLYPQVRETLGLVVGVRTIFHTCSNGHAISANVFLERGTDDADRGHKLLLTSPEYVDALVNEMIQRLNDAQTATLAEKRVAYLAAYHAFLQAWPFERGEIEIGAALFAGFHLGLFDEKLRVHLKSQQWFEMLTLGQSNFDTAMRRLLGWPSG